MAINNEDTGVLPINFFSDVVAAQSPAIVSYEFKYGDKSVEVKCRKSLSYNEKYMFTRGAWEYYISADTNGNKDYRPYLLDLIIRFFTVRLYCVNLPISNSDDFSVYEEFLINTGFYEELLKHINITDYRTLISSVHEYINKRCEANAAAAKSTVDISLADALTKLSTLVDLINDKFKDFDTDSINALLSGILPDGGVLNGEETGSV